MVLDMLPTTAVAVPKISRLRGMINYDDDRKPLGPTFWKHFQAYREMYTTSPRIYGSTFIQWKDPGQMTGLIEMADAFLDRDKNGAKFWPDDEDADEYSNLRYSVHDRFIKSIIVQLFFRLNLQHYQNHKYKENKSRRASTQSGNNHRLPTNATTSASAQVDTSRPSTSGQGASTSAEPQSRPDFSQERVIHNLVDPTLQAQTTGNSADDPWIVPGSPRSTLEAGQSSFQANINTGSGSATKRPTTETSSAAKRQKKGKADSSKKPTAQRPRRPKATVQVSRSSSRVRRQPRRDSAAPDHVLDEILRSPSPTTRSPGHASAPPQNENNSTDEPPPPEVPGDGPVAPDVPDPQQQPPGTPSPPVEDPMEEAYALQRRTLQEESDAPDSRSSIPSFPPVPTESTRASPSTVANESHVGVNPADSEATPRLAPLKIPPAIGPRSEHQENHQMPSIEQDKDMTMSYTRAQTAPLPSKHRSTRYRAPIAVMSSATSGIEDTVVEVPEETVVDGAGNGLNHVGQNQLPNHREEEPQDRDHPARDHEAHSQTIDHGRHEEPQSRGPDHTAAINPEQGNGEVDNIHPNRGGCDGSEKTLPSEKPLQKNEAAATAAPKVQFTFVIILARYPWQEREWTPQGKFLKKTLSQLKSELPTGFAEASRGIMFRLGGPGVDTEQPVFHGQDRKFDSMKKYFNTQIREEMDKYTNGETLPFRIEIEALQEAFLRENKEDEDELF